MRVFLSSLIMLLGACLTMTFGQDTTLNVYNPDKPVVSVSGSITLLPAIMTTIPFRQRRYLVLPHPTAVWVRAARLKDC